MIEREDRKVNGKLKGRYYDLKNGSKLYLEHVSGEKTKSLDTKKNAWLLPTATIRQAEYKGCTAIGVLHKIGKKQHVYIVPIEHFLSEPSETYWAQGKEPMRCLNRNLFVINSTRSIPYIESTLKIR